MSNVDPKPSQTPQLHPVWTFLLIVALSTSVGFMGWRFLRQKQHDREFFADRFAARKEGPSDLDGKGFGAVARFQLTDESGKPFLSSSLLGKVWIADFIFTNCAGPCPALSAEFERIRTELGQDPDFHMVSFTVDPRRDTPEVLARYAESYGGARGNWHLLTGDVSEIAAIASQSFKAGLATSDDPAEITHSIRIFLVDRRGVIRGRYLLEAPDELRMLRSDVKTLLSRPAR